MRPSRLLVDGLGAEGGKIENNKAIANTRGVESIISSFIEYA
jgi:hypothetical protein